MAITKRPWGVYAGPIIFVLGIGVFWGVQRARAMKDTVEGWGYRLEHTAEPVVMENLLPYFPIFVNGDWIGGLESIEVLRSEEASIDSIRIVASMRDRVDEQDFEDCTLRFRAHMEPPFFRHALRCTADTTGVAYVGSLSFRATDLVVPIVIDLDDLPCDHGGDLHLGVCDHFEPEHQAHLEARLAEGLEAALASGLEAELAQGIEAALAGGMEAELAGALDAELAEELRALGEQLRIEVHQLRDQAHLIRAQVRTEVQNSVRVRVRPPKD